MINNVENKIVSLSSPYIFLLKCALGEHTSCVGLQNFVLALSRAQPIVENFPIHSLCKEKKKRKKKSPKRKNEARTVDKANGARLSHSAALYAPIFVLSSRAAARESPTKSSALAGHLSIALEEVTRAALAHMQTIL